MMMIFKASVLYSERNINFSDFHKRNVWIIIPVISCHRLMYFLTLWRHNKTQNKHKLKNRSNELLLHKSLSES